jgi:hypothetical protein
MPQWLKGHSKLIHDNVHSVYTLHDTPPGAWHISVCLAYQEVSSLCRIDVS